MESSSMHVLTYMVIPGQIRVQVIMSDLASLFPPLALACGVILMTTGYESSITV